MLQFERKFDWGRVRKMSKRQSLRLTLPLARSLPSSVNHRLVIEGVVTKEYLLDLKHWICDLFSMSLNLLIKIVRNIN